MFERQVEVAVQAREAVMKKCAAVQKKTGASPEVCLQALKASSGSVHIAEAWIKSNRFEGKIV